MERHLEPEEVAAYVDGAVDAAGRRGVEAHLATCAECRSEIVDVGSVVRTVPRSSGRRYWIPAAAAAAAVLLVWVAPFSDPEPAGVHRDEAVTLTAAPRVTPSAGPDSAPSAVWALVPGADRYRVKLYDGAGAVLWERESTDTTAILPDSIPLDAGTQYYWRVESHSGFGRWSPSELVRFVPGRIRDP